jgi:tetratricopeptide (TPR) repeat protein
VQSPEDRRARRFQAALLLAACLIPFANSLTGDFTYDDKAIVRDNVRIQSPETLGQVFETSYFGGTRGSGTAYRPILLLSYAVQWWIHGRRALPFHAVNVLLHAAATFCVWGLWRRLRFPTAAVLAAAFLFAVHPIHVEAVASLVGRGETLAALFALLYLHLALRLRDGPPRRAAVLSAALLLYALALLTKESAAAAPALAFLCYFRLAQGGTFARAQEALRRGFRLYAGSALVLAGYFGLRAWVLGGWLKSGRSSIFEVENPLASLSAIARVGNASLLLVRYVGRILFPLRLSADESAWSIRPVPAASALAIAAVLLLAALAALALARPRSTAGFGVLFFGIALLPASNLLFSIGTIFAERLAYLPSAGICLIAGAALAGSAERLGRLSRARQAALATVLLLLAIRTVIRNTVWRSDLALFENSAEVAPGSAKNHYNLGYIRAEHGRFREGLEAYRRATEIYPKYWDAWTGKSRCERELGMLSAARRSCERALEAHQAYENGFFCLGLVLEATGKDAEALEVYRKGLAKNPASLPLAFRAATLASRLGDPRARAAWESALKGHPASLSARFGYAKWLEAQGDRAGSLRELRRILSAAPRDVAALRLQAEVNASAGRAFAAALSLERIFRATRLRSDLAPLREAARRDPAYERRWRALEPSFRKMAPWAFPPPPLPAGMVRPAPAFSPASPASAAAGS